MKLNDIERSMLAGELGAAAKSALEHQIKVGDFFGAADFVPVTQAHIMADTESLGEAGVAWREELTGSPVLEDALAWLDCRLWRTHEGGDHTIFVGEIVAGDARDGAPLAYYRSGFARLTP
jgi:hypothetical protein